MNNDHDLVFFLYLSNTIKQLQFNIELRGDRQSDRQTDSDK